MNISISFSGIIIICNLFNRLNRNTACRVISLFEMPIKKIINFARLFNWTIVLRKPQVWPTYFMPQSFSSRKLKYEGMKTAGDTDYTNQTPSKNFGLIKCLSPATLKNKQIFIECAQNKRCSSFIYEQLLCKVRILRNENCWSYRIHKPATFKASYGEKSLSSRHLKMKRIP